MLSSLLQPHISVFIMKVFFFFENYLCKRQHFQCDYLQILIRIFTHASQRLKILFKVRHLKMFEQYHQFSFSNDHTMHPFSALTRMYLLTLSLLIELFSLALNEAPQHWDSSCPRKVVHERFPFQALGDVLRCWNPKKKFSTWTHSTSTKWNLSRTTLTLDLNTLNNHQTLGNASTSGRVRNAWHNADSMIRHKK